MFWFGWYYFNQYFTHATPEHHLSLTRNLQFEEDFKYLLNIGHKDSGKTSWARIAFIWRICTGKSKFMCFICHDKNKAESHLFDISVELQANQKIVEDFGQLFYEDPAATVKRSKKKSIDEFITSNGIKVKAYSTAMSIRGEIYDSYRPDYLNFDDIENDKTKRSEAKTSEVKNFIDESLSGTTAAACVVFSVNKISKSGVVAWLEQKANNNPDFRVWEQKLIENGIITWGARFVWTDKEAQRINSQTPDRKKHVFSIQERKRTLGSRRFEQEYQLIPIADSDSVIKEHWVTDNYYTDLPTNGIKRIIMMDPQAGESKDADYYGICMLAFKRKDPNRYICTVQKGRAKKLAQAAKLIKLWQKYKDEVVLVGVEVVMTQNAVYQNILEWKAGNIDLGAYGVDDDDRNIPIKKVRPVGKDGKVLKDKVARLEMHEAAFERGEIHLHHTMRKFTENLCAFPDVQNDDDIDAMIYCLDYSYKSSFANVDDSDYNAEEKSTIVGNVLNKKF